MDQKSNYHDNNYVSKFLQDAVDYYSEKIKENKKKILKHRNLIVAEANNERECIKHSCDDLQDIPTYEIYLKGINVKIEEQQEQLQMHKKYLDHFTEIQKLRCCECAEES